MNRLVYLAPLIVVGLIAFLFGIGLRNHDDSLPSAMIGRSAPPFAETGLEGYPNGNIDVLIAEHNVVLVNYWASWCGPCRAEHSKLQEISDRGVPVIGINFKDSPENARAFLSELGNPFTAIRTTQDGRNAIEWGVSGVPETFFVSREGKILRRHAGPITSSALERDIWPFLQELNQTSQ